MQSGVALVDLCETLGKEEFVATHQPGRCQRRDRIEKVCSDLVLLVRDGYQQPFEVLRASHGDCSFLVPGCAAFRHRDAKD
jgi:hypothetical protein